MIRIVVTTDERNAALGPYFVASKEYLAGMVENQEWESCLHVMGSNECKSSYVRDTLPAVCGGNPFICVVFSHGNEKACVAGGASYIDESNAESFGKSLFYSTACLNGKELGAKLLEAGCSAFVGFRAESYAYSKVGEQNTFINCDMACLFWFLTNEGKTLGEAFKDAIAYYNSQIDKYNSLLDMPFKGMLIENRNALTLLGNKELKREDLEF